MSRATASADNEMGDDDDTRIIAHEELVQTYYDVLNDAGCRSILAATSEDTLSAREISETCELPLSTTYRKLEILTDIGLLEESIRIRPSGKHPKEYTCPVGNVRISFDEMQEIQLHDV